MQSRLRLQAITLLLCMALTTGHAQEVLYSWQSPNGTVEETGGKLEHFNQNGRDKRNIECGGYHTFVLNGDRAYIDLPYNVNECSYMKITLSGGRTFSEGDEIEVTAMRNNVADRPASIYFLFHTPSTSADGREGDVPLIDTNTWNNLGRGTDSSFSGSGEAKGHYPAAPTRAAFTPSTHTFTVPKEANGARYVRLTRNETGNLLYVISLTVRHKEASGINNAKTEDAEAGKARKIVKHGRLLIQTKDHTYDTTGARLR